MTTFSNRFFSSSVTAACAVLSLCTLVSLTACNNSTETGGAPPPTSVGTEIDDSVVTNKVRGALMSYEDIKSLDIKVRTHKGEVMLSGFVDSQAQVDRSVSVAKNVEGVTHIDNQLSVKVGKQSVGNKIDDTVITGQVKAALISDPMMKSMDVLVSTRNGEVQLSGFVNNNAQLTQAMNIAKSVAGVSGVANHMNVKK